MNIKFWKTFYMSGTERLKLSEKKLKSTFANG